MATLAKSLIPAASGCDFPSSWGRGLSLNGNVVICGMGSEDRRANSERRLDVEMEKSRQMLLQQSKELLSSDLAELRIHKTERKATPGSFLDCAPGRM